MCCCWPFVDVELEDAPKPKPKPTPAEEEKEYVLVSDKLTLHPGVSLLISFTLPRLIHGF